MLLLLFKSAVVLFLLSKIAYDAFVIVLRYYALLGVILWVAYYGGR